MDKYYSKEFMGMKYPFKECVRPELKRLHENACQQCSVFRFCEAPNKEAK